MAKIDVGNFGTSTIDIAQPARTAVVGEAVAQLGDALGQVARQKIEQRYQEQAAIASNNLLDHQLANQKIVQDIGDQLASGELQPEDAQAAYQKANEGNALPSVDNLHPIAAAAYNRGAQRVQAEGGFKIDALADVARGQRFKNQFAEAGRKLEDLAGAPNTPPEKIAQIIEQLKTFVPVGRAAHISQAELDATVQATTDRIWLNHATQREIGAHDDMAGLRALQKDLSDKNGLYVDKLRTGSRDALLAQVGNRMDVIQNHLEHVAATRENDGARAMNEFDRQISTGVTAPPAQLAQWAQRTAGTTSAADFQEAIANEQKVQEALKLPPAEQIKLANAEQERIYKQGGTVREQQDANRFGQAVRANITKMQTDPLIWLNERAGVETPPLDLSSALTPQGQAQITAQLFQRALDIRTAQEKNGPAIQMRPLLPPEVQQLGAIVAAASPDNVTGLFSRLYQMTNKDDRVFGGMMTQIAPDHPVLAFAGLRSLQDPKVASYIVQGESALNPTKQQKQNDGKPDVGLYAPTDEALQPAFALAVGDLYRNSRDGAAETAYQAFKAYYIGKAKHDSALLEKTGQADPKRVQEALNSVIGTVIDYNGQGNVSAPWGMDRSTFNTRIDTAWSVAEQRYNLPKTTSAQRAAIGLQNADTGIEGQYVIPNGGQWLTVVRNGKAVPVILDLNDPAVVHPTSPPFNPGYDLQAGQNYMP